jgi:DNA-directed RNA polymerase specialized sigma24 family protein
MTSDQINAMVSYQQAVTHLRGLIIDYVRNCATMEDLVQIAMICNPAVAEIIREVRDDG